MLLFKLDNEKVLYVREVISKGRLLEIMYTPI